MVGVHSVTIPQLRSGVVESLKESMYPVISVGGIVSRNGSGGKLY